MLFEVFSFFFLVEIFESESFGDTFPIMQLTATKIKLRYQFNQISASSSANYTKIEKEGKRDGEGSYYLRLTETFYFGEDSDPREGNIELKPREAP